MYDRINWRQFKLGDILKRKRDIQKISPNQRYKLLTVKLYHKGIVLRKEVIGSELGSVMSKVKSGDFVLSGIDARNGAFGIVPNHLDGAIITNDFWCLEPDEKKINKDFLLFLTSTEYFDYICKQSSDGTTQRIRLQKDRFFDTSISLPPIYEQKKITLQLKNFSEIKEATSNELTHQQDLVKQLRQSFLREAMQGKLTEQKKEDGNAHDQLEKIKAEKGKSVKKVKPLLPIKEEEIPFEIPKNWVWCRLGEIINFISGNNFNSTDFTKGEGIRCIKITNAGVGELIETEDVLPFSFLEKYKSYLVFENDLVLALTRPYISDGLKISRCSNLYHNSLLNQRVAVIRVKSNISSDYIYRFLQSDYILGMYKAKFEGKGQQPNLKKEDVTELLVPIPPHTEQLRIVKKLEVLMQLCDEIQSSIKNSQKQNEMLLQQVLREALAG